MKPKSHEIVQHYGFFPRGAVLRILPILALWLATMSLAAEPPTCPPDAGQTATPTRLMRSISLDIRGIVPEVDEYAAVTADGPSATTLDAWLQSPEFTAQVVRHHRSLFWNNVENVDLIDNDSRLNQRGDIWFIDDNPALVRRGVNDAHCGDFEATFDAWGNPITIPGVGGAVEEGWVWVAPYWDPTTPIKVCAFDAATLEFTQLGTDCKSRQAEFDAQCGCGPALQWCRVNGIDEVIDRGFGTDVDLRVARMIDEDRSYLDLFRDNTGFINGPMAHFYRHQTGKHDDVNFAPGQVDPARIPDLDFLDTETFVEVDLGAPHAGVLTSPAWLLRFQTNRGRANRFYNSFLCQPFQPPDGGIEGLDAPNPTLDLTARAGCQYCHALLEPAAAHWGRWPQAGAGYLDPVEFPAFDAECEACAVSNITCSDRCDALYVTDPLTSEEYSYLGWMLSYEFLEERHVDHVEQGPQLLVTSTTADGRLPTCIASRTAEWLLGRTMGEADQPWIGALADDFVTSGFRYRVLVKQIVTSDNYRRVR